MGKKEEKPVTKKQKAEGGKAAAKKEKAPKKTKAEGELVIMR